MGKFTGQFGIALLLDSETSRTAVGINRYLASGNAIDLQNKHIPHVTLYHAAFENAEIENIFDVLSLVKSALPKHHMRFRRIDVYSEKFVFWHLEDKLSYMYAHLIALSLSALRSIPEQSQADKENLTLSEDEQRNMDWFGHPLVKDLWQPHITVGYYPDGAGGVTESVDWLGMVETVAFVEVGDYGTIKKIVHQVKC